MFNKTHLGLYKRATYQCPHTHACNRTFRHVMAKL